jgi:hypothetical protein
VTHINGQGPLAGWSIVVTNGLVLIGHELRCTSTEDDGTRRLQPAYELKPQLMQGPQGQTGIGHAVLPLLLLGSLSVVDVPEGAVWIPVASLDLAERRGMEKAVAQCEEMTQAMRRQRSGVVLAHAGSIGGLPRRG